MSHKLWIMRHGDAPYKHGERALSQQGYQASKTTAMMAFQRALQEPEAHKVLPSQLWASPLIRAEQTAQAVLEALSECTAQRLGVDYSHKLQLSSEKELVPEGDVSLLAALIEATVTTQNLFLTSHMPLVSNLLQALCPHITRFFETADIIELDCTVDIHGNVLFQLSQLFQYHQKAEF